MKAIQRSMLAWLIPAAFVAGADKTVPAGTEIAIRTNEAIESKSASGGRTYAAQVEKEVADAAGGVVIPRGSEARLIIRDASDPTLKTTQLVLDLYSITIDGKTYMVSTDDMKRSGRKGIGKNRRTAEMVGGGAALGTLLGAIAGGGKGAAIGAISGAAAGGAVQVLTKGKEVKVPAESVLTFRFDQELRLASR